MDKRDKTVEVMRNIKPDVKSNDNFHDEKETQRKVLQLLQSVSGIDEEKIKSGALDKDEWTKLVEGAQSIGELRLSKDDI